METVKGIHYETGEPICVDMTGGKIAAIRPWEGAGEGLLPKRAGMGDGTIGGGMDRERSAAGNALRDASAPGLTEVPYLAPGLVDLQINGCGGVDLNLFPLDPDRVRDLVREVWKEGVTTFCPTVTTNTVERIEEAMRTIARACEEDEGTKASASAIHLEGPFLSPEDGPRGAQRREYVRAPDWDLFCRWQEAAGGRIRLVTLSPEWPDAAAFIRRAVASGMQVAIGHTAATPEQIREAVAAGARLSTHYGNGAHLMLPRHPNYLWEQLAQDELWVSLIADGFHLPVSVLKVAMAVKREKAILVSDAVHLSGMPPGSYFSHNRVHVVKTSEGRLQLADQPQLLAGSAQMLPWGIAHLVRSGLCGLPEAWNRASIRPAAFLGLDAAGGMKAGSPADLVQFTVGEDREIKILRTYVQGELCHTDGAQKDMI